MDGVLDFEKNRWHICVSVKMAFSPE
jgi:hypothetical protein